MLKRTLQIWWSILWRQAVAGGVVGGALGFAGGYLAAVAGNPQNARSIGALLGWLASTPISIWAMNAALAAHSAYLIGDVGSRGAKADLGTLSLEQSLHIWWSFVWRTALAAIPVSLGLGAMGGFIVGITGSPNLGLPVGLILGWLSVLPVSIWALGAALRRHDVQFNAAPQQTSSKTETENYGKYRKFPYVLIISLPVGIGLIFVAASLWKLNIPVLGRGAAMASDTGDAITELPTCYLYWDGLATRRGRTKGDNFKRLEIEHTDGLKVEFAIPMSVYANYGFASITGGQTAGWNDVSNPAVKWMRENFFPVAPGLCGP